MDIKQKKKAIHSGLYVVLALMVATVTVVSIFTLTAKRGKDPGEVPDQTQNPIHTTEQMPDETTDSKDKPKDTTTAPLDDVKTPDTDIGAEVLEPVTPAEPVYIMPVAGHISKDFCDSVLIYSLTMDDYRTHMGIDICAAVGTPVCVFSDGTIAEVYEDPLCGMTVAVSHANGLTSYYMNLQKDLPGDVTVGRELKAGDVIGGIGETMITEIADASHLHFELKRGDNYVDPMDYLTSYTGAVDYTE